MVKFYSLIFYSILITGCSANKDYSNNSTINNPNNINKISDYKGIYGDLAIGDNAICLVSSGDLNCWQLRVDANGNRTDYIYPKNIKDAKLVALGLEYGCVVYGTNDTITCWGNRAPISVPNNLPGVKKIKIDYKDQLCAIFTSGVRCWSESNGEFWNLFPKNTTITDVDSNVDTSACVVMQELGVSKILCTSCRSSATCGTAIPNRTGDREYFPNIGMKNYQSVTFGGGSSFCVYNEQEYECWDYELSPKFKWIKIDSNASIPRPIYDMKNGCIAHAQGITCFQSANFSGAAKIIPIFNQAAQKVVDASYNSFCVLSNSKVLCFGNNPVLIPSKYSLEKNLVLQCNIGISGSLVESSTSKQCMVKIRIRDRETYQIRNEVETPCEQSNSSIRFKEANVKLSENTYLTLPRADGYSIQDFYGPTFLNEVECLTELNLNKTDKSNSTN